MRNHLSVGALFGLLLVPCLSCDLPVRPGFGPLAEENVLLRLVPTPPAWAGLEGLAFLLEYRSMAGEESVLLAPGAELEVALPSGRSQALLAWPIWRGERLLPAGARYPEELEAAGPGLGPGLLNLDFPRGFVAFLQRELRREGFDPRALNLERLGRELGLRVPDPWSLDRGRLLSGLVGGAFRADSLRAPPPGEALAAGPGPWVAESPFSPAAEALSDGSWLLRGAAGARVFLCPEGRRVLELR